MLNISRLELINIDLSELRNQAEMAHTCRGTISLHGAVIHTENQSANFIVSNGGGTQVIYVLDTFSKILFMFKFNYILGRFSISSNFTEHIFQTDFPPASH